mmetsp:Transcript_14881/g.27513  ORF Transcript_14881/g.27513 Transcript_14881/m.27513 type:complete len:115 (-) Transcript_14881:547-891(-)
MAAPTEKGWSEPFCSFFEEAGPFLLVWWLGSTGIALIQCHNQDAIHHKGGVLSYFCVCCLGSYGAAYNRMKVRGEYQIKGNYCLDFLAYWCGCGLCASVQEYREVLKAHPHAKH